MAENYNLNIEITEKGVEEIQGKFDSLRKEIDETEKSIEKLSETEGKSFQERKHNAKVADELRKKLAGLHLEYDGLTKIQTDYNKGLKNTGEDLGSLQVQINNSTRRLEALTLAGQQGSKEFQDLTNHVKNLKDAQEETKSVIKGTTKEIHNSGDAVHKFETAAEGIGGALEVGAVALSAFGMESEAVEEKLLLVQQAMLLSDGIKSVQKFSESFGLASKATKSFTLVQKGLNLVLAANPFALMVTAIVTIIGLFAVFTDAVDVVIANLKAVSDWLGITDSEAEEMASKREAEAKAAAQQEELARKRAERLHKSKMSALDNEINLARAQGKDTTELQKKKLKNEIVLKEAALATLLVEEAKIEAYRAQLLAMSKQAGLTGQLGRAGLEGLEEHKTKLEDTKAEIEKLKTDLKIVDIEAKKSRTKTKSFDKKDTKEEKAEKERIKKEKKELENERKRLQNLQKLRDDFETSLEAETDIANKRLISEQEFEIQLVQDKYFNLIEQAKQYGLDTSVLIENQRIAEAEINKKYEDEAKEKKKIKDAKDKKDAQELALAKAQMAIDGLRLVSDVAQLFAGKSEKAAKRAFQIKKVADIAEATMSGYKAVISTFANAPGGPVLKGIAAGLAGAFSAVQIGKIASAQFGGGVKDVDSDIPTEGDVAAAAPQFNVVGDTGTQLAQIQQQPMQAFVVSGEVTTAQSLDRNRIQNATI